MNQLAKHKFGIDQQLFDKLCDFGHIADPDEFAKKYIEDLQKHIRILESNELLVFYKKLLKTKDEIIEVKNEIINNIKN